LKVSKCETLLYCKVSVCSQATFFNDFGRQKLPDTYVTQAA
jgi:hypothetical protein